MILKLLSKNDLHVKISAMHRRNNLFRLWQVAKSDLLHVKRETCLLEAEYHSKFPFVSKMHSTYKSQNVHLEIYIWEHGVPKRVFNEITISMTAMHLNS